MCLPCARNSVRLCPYLRRAFIAVRVKSPRIGGVYGRLYQPGWPFPRAGDEAIVPYGAAKARWIIASQLVMGLHDCTFVDLETEIAARESDGSP